jgi:hypothetical protein
MIRVAAAAVISFSHSNPRIPLRSSSSRRRPRTRSRVRTQFPELIRISRTPANIQQPGTTRRELPGVALGGIRDAFGVAEFGVDDFAGGDFGFVVVFGGGA